MNSRREFAANASDHDPSVARFTLRLGDLDGNACVDHHDLLILLAALHHRSEDAVTYDFDGDGRVNARDVGPFVRLFSRPFGLPCR